MMPVASVSWRRLVQASLLCLALCVPALGKLCGDDVEGRDVGCACGDTVVSDVVLGAGDPVVSTVCARNGLVVRVMGMKAGVTIDLRGAALRGTGRGSGLWVQQGGGSGAQVISTGGRATISGFRDGVESMGGVALLEGVRIEGSGRDGVRLNGVAYAVRGVEVEGSGRDGFSLRGAEFQLEGTRAVRSGRFGYFVQGTHGGGGGGGAVGPWAEQSGAAGFQVMGMGHRMVGCVAAGGSKDGIHLLTMVLTMQGCQARGNGGDGIGGLVGDGWFKGNEASENGGSGIEVDGPGIEDAGGNRGAGNRGEGRLLGQAVVQCELGGVTCSP